VSDERVAPKITTWTLAAWRSALDDTQDDERERHIVLPAEPARLLALIRQALDHGSATLSPDDIAQIEELTGIDAEYTERA
jgi:hypothetical protein